MFKFQSPIKAILYAQLNNSSQPESVISCSKRKVRHRRTGSGSPRTSCSSRASTVKCTNLVDTETQTDTRDISETDSSPNGCYSLRTFQNGIPQRVVIKEVQQTSDEEVLNGNCIQLQYLEQEPGK